MSQEITVFPTTGYTTPPKGMEFTARIRTDDGKGISGKSNYGATAETAKANLLARLESEGHRFEDVNGEAVMQYVNADGHLKDAPEWRSEDGCCNDCFVTSHDVPRGHVWVAVPEGCGDEDCDCHNTDQMCRCGHAESRHKFEVFSDNPHEYCSGYKCPCGIFESAKPSPYCETGKLPSVGEIAVVAVVVIGLFIFGLGLQIAEGAAK